MKLFYKSMLELDSIRSKSKASSGLRKKGKMILFSALLLLAGNNVANAQYCTSNATSTADEEIYSVSFGTMTNTSTCSTTGGTGSLLNQYSNYTNATPAVAIPSVVQGFPYPLSVEIGTCGGNYGNRTRVWIDYNQNGLFTDAGEMVYETTGSINGAHIENAIVTIPAGATLGNTRMRVTTSETTSLTLPNPCGTFTWGEVEDYLVNIIPPLATDAGVIAFANPTMPTCNFTDSVKVVISNFGTDTLESCTVNWSWEGVTQTPVLWTGSLPLFATDTVTLGLVAYAGGNNFSAWTSLPNMVTEDPAGAYNDQTNITGLLAGLSGTYTVGGATPDFPDLITAISTLNTAGVCGPVVFDVRSGLYTGQYTLTTAIGMNDMNTVTIRSEQMHRDSVVFEFSGTGLTDNFVFLFEGADYYNLEHLTLQNPGATYGRNVHMRGSADYNNFLDVKMSTPATTSTSNYKAVLFTDNSLDDFNTFDGCSFVGGSYGAYLNGSSSTSTEEGNKVLNSEFQDNYYMALYSWYQKTPTFNHNRMFGNSTYASRYAMYLAYNHGGVEATHNSIESDSNSYFTNGIYLYYSDATPSSRALIANNSIVVGRPGSTASTLSGLTIYYSGFADAINNSVNVIGGTASSRAAYLYGGGANKAINNNFITNGLGYSVYLYGAYTLSQCDYNNLKSTGAYLGYFNVNLTTFDAWKTATNFDANSLSVNPGYYSDFDLHVCSDSIDGKGMVSPLVTDDLDGNVRNTATPDIGSDEFAPLGTPGFAGPDLTICVGDTVTLLAGSPMDSVLWSNGVPTPENVISNTGTYDVVVVGACGISFDTVVVSASALMYNDFIVADTTAFCTGGSVVLTTSIPALTYSWTGGNTSDSLTVTNGGIIVCNITDACGTGTQSITITEQSAPVASFSNTSSYLTYIFTNTSTSLGSGTTYTWNFGDGSLNSNAVNPSHVFPSAGPFSVTLTVTNACGSNSVTQEYSVLGLEEVANIGEIGVYPNPSNGVYNVDFKLSNEMDATILVTNVLGETVFVRDLGNISGASNSVIDITSAAPGVYYVSIVSNNNTVYNTRVVKQ